MTPKKDGAWRNRIVGHGEEAPDQLLANPANWRIHPKAQQDTLAGVLSEVGWVQNVIVNRRTGFVVDGHLRVALAISKQEPTIPVVYVDLEPHEEALILATIDPLAAMAATDKAQLDALLRDVETGDAAVMQMLAELTEKEKVVPTSSVSGDLAYQNRYELVVECESESSLQDLFERLTAEGLTCRTLIL